jgi:hypothetical protein
VRGRFPQFLHKILRDACLRVLLRAKFPRRFVASLTGRERNREATHSQERRFSNENDTSGDSRISWNLERAQRFHKQVAMLFFSVPTDTRVATCDDDPTDGFGYWALTHLGSTRRPSSGLKKAAPVLRLPALLCDRKIAQFPHQPHSPKRRVGRGAFTTFFVMLGPSALWPILYWIRAATSGGGQASTSFFRRAYKNSWPLF